MRTHARNLPRRTKTTSERGGSLVDRRARFVLPGGVGEGLAGAARIGQPHRRGSLRFVSSALPAGKQGMARSSVKFYRSPVAKPQLTFDNDPPIDRRRTGIGRKQADRVRVRGIHGKAVGRV
jgi:hypothetical protein